MSCLEGLAVIAQRLETYMNEPLIDVGAQHVLEGSLPAGKTTNKAYHSSIKKKQQLSIACA